MTATRTLLALLLLYAAIVLAFRADDEDNPARPLEMTRPDEPPVLIELGPTPREF